MPFNGGRGEDADESDGSNLKGFNEEEDGEEEGAFFNFRKDLYCWDTRYDYELGIVTGLKGRFRKFPAVQRLMHEARMRRDMLEDYQESLMQGTKGLYFNYTKTKKNLLCPPPDDLVAKARKMAENVTLTRMEDQYKSLTILKKLMADHGPTRVKILPKKFEELTKKEIPGATVLRPKKGYKRKPRITCDFNSLYPNIMLSGNMSDETKLTLKHIAEYGLKDEQDYYTVITKQHEDFYKMPLCRDCTEGLHHIETHPTPDIFLDYEERDRARIRKLIEECQKEVGVEKERIRKFNLKEDRDFYTLVKSVEKVYFLKQICDECTTCLDCDKARDTDPGGFCSKHTTCDKCPKIRHRAVLCGVLKRLLDLREVNKRLKKEAEEKAKEVWVKYLAAIGLPLDTEMGKLKKYQLASSPEHYTIWDQYEFWLGQAEIFDGRQNSNKLTCNSAYGFKGARFGICPDKEIAMAVTGEGRRMIELISAKIKGTATEWKSFWGECTKEVAEKDYAKTMKKSGVKENHHLVCLDDDEENG
jgi:hypothetical protein